MLLYFRGLQIQGRKRLPKEDEFWERFGGRRLGIAEEDDLLFPHGAFHGEKADISIRDLLSNAAHVADDAVNLMVLALEEVKAVLHTFAAQRLELLAEEGLVFGFWHIISKHHEHGERRGGRGQCSERVGRVQKTLPPNE